LNNTPVHSIRLLRYDFSRASPTLPHRRQRQQPAAKRLRRPDAAFDGFKEFVGVGHLQMALKTDGEKLEPLLILRFAALKTFIHNVDITDNKAILFSLTLQPGQLLAFIKQDDPLPLFELLVRDVVGKPLDRVSP
jgi:hypothetical protein